MAITVTGMDNTGQPYSARLGLTADEFEDTPGGAYGDTVRASHIIAAALRAAHGRPVPLTPTGPSTDLHDFDTNSVLAWLRENTTVISAVTDNGDPLPRDLRVGSSDTPNPDVIH